MSDSHDHGENLKLSLTSRTLKALISHIFAVRYTICTLANYSMQLFAHRRSRHANRDPRRHDAFVSCNSQDVAADAQDQKTVYKAMQHGLDDTDLDSA